MNLYQIANVYQLTLSELSEMDDLPQQLIDDTMTAIGHELEEKIINCAAFMQNIEADIQGMKSYEASMYAKRKRLEATQERLKEYIKTAMIACDLKKVKGKEFDVSIKKMPPKLIIDDETMIPTEYLTRKIEYKIDSKAVKDCIMSGTEVPGTYLKEVVGLSIK